MANTDSAIDAHATRPGLLIFSRPARGNRRSNPYTYLLSEALTGCGCTVTDFSRRRGLLRKPDIVHIHWPQSEVLGALPTALYKSAWLAARLIVQRLRGTPIVWTVHNLHGHDQNNKQLEAALMWLTTRLVTGLVFLGPSSRTSAFTKWPILARKQSIVIPHGLYGVPEDAARSRDEARTRLGIESDVPIIGFVGDIKPYKGLDTLLDAFTGLGPGEATLLIAGRFLAAEDYAAEQRRKIAEMQAVGHRIVFLERRLDDRELADAIRACDFNAMPYRQITNSGFALLTLELGGRILCSDAPVFAELRDEIGDGWLAAFKQWDAAALRRAMATPMTATDEARIDAFRQKRAWPAIGLQTVLFYRSLLYQGLDVERTGRTDAVGRLRKG